LALRIFPHQFAIIDNAAIHKTIEARIRLEDVFNGNYRFCAPYSPHLKPIEKAFKLVKEEISYLEINNFEACNHPVRLINNAFLLYHIDGPKAGSIRGCFNDYFALHENFLNGEL
jgi:hypothetical protein